MNYSEKIAYILKSSGLSQQSLAEKLGTSFVTLNNWVNGKVSPTRKDLMQRIDVFYEKECLKGNPMNTVMIGDNKGCLEKLLADGIYFDVIYIDPPYNTGNKLSFNDRRSAEGWVQFMEDRLNPARGILKEDGVIFISIDDNSLYELKLSCDRIFGRSNFLGTFITKQAIRSNSNHINIIHEYIVAYAKDKKKLGAFKIKRTDSPNDASMIADIEKQIHDEFVRSGKKSAEKLLSKTNQEYMKKRNITWLKNYAQVDEDGRVFFAKDLSVPGEPNKLVIDEINLKLPALSTRRWSSPKKFIKLYHENKLYFKNGRPYEKHYLCDSYDNVSTILDFYSRQGTNDLNKLGLRGLFDTPKPVELIKYLIRIATFKKDNALVLDFFAGSGTTGQAVMEINIENHKNHVFYLAQIDERLAQDSLQYKFAARHNIRPTVDQLMIYRLNTVRKKLHYGGDYNIVQIIPKTLPNQ